MQRSLSVLALALIQPVASAQAPANELIGIYSRGSGSDRTSELIVHEDPEAPARLKAYVTSLGGNGYSCSMHGVLSNATSAGFTVTDNLLGFSCSLTMKREGANLKIIDEKGCKNFCGIGGSFSRAPYKKVCGTVSADIVSATELRLVIADPDYGPACPKPK